MSAGRGPGWLPFGVPAAVSVVLGVIAGIWVSRATAARPGLSVVLGAVAAVAAWALWEAWRAVRDARRDDNAGGSVLQTARRGRGRLTRWAGALPARGAARIAPRGRAGGGGGEGRGGEVTGADARGGGAGPPQG